MAKESYVPYLRISDLRRWAAVYDTKLSDALLSLNPGVVLNLGESVTSFANAKGIQSAILITTHRLESGYHDLCAAQTIGPVSSLFPFYSNGPEPSSGGQPKSLMDINAIGRIRVYYEVGLWVLFFLVVLDLAQIWRYPLKVIPLVLGNTLVIAIGVIVLLHCLGLVPVQWKRITLELDRATNVRGNLYAVDLGIHWKSHTGIWEYPVRLYEDGIELGPPDQKLPYITSEGAGGYTVIDGILYFSSSDNTNPMKNGREYQVVGLTPVRQRYQWLFYFLTILGLFVYFRYIKRLSYSTHT
jgi:hypothetical protein